MNSFDFYGISDERIAKWLHQETLFTEENIGCFAKHLFGNFCESNGFDKYQNRLLVAVSGNYNDSQPTYINDSGYKRWRGNIAMSSGNIGSHSGQDILIYPQFIEALTYNLNKFGLQDEQVKNDFITFLEVLDHECYHMNMARDLLKPSKNPLALLCAQECVLTVLDRDFYRKHHDDFLIERIVDMQGFSQTCNNLKVFFPEWHKEYSSRNTFFGRSLAKDESELHADKAVGERIDALSVNQIKDWYKTQSCPLPFSKSIFSGMYGKKQLQLKRENCLDRRILCRMTNIVNPFLRSILRKTKPMTDTRSVNITSKNLSKGR